MRGDTRTDRTELRAEPRPPAGRAGFRQAIGHEWIKFTSVRSTLWTAVAAGTVTALGAVFVALSESLQPDDTVLGGSLTLAVVGQMLAAVFGVLVVSGEYASGTIRTTLTACPRRGTVVAAKTTLVASVLYAVGLISCTAAYLLGDALLPSGTYAQGEPLPALFGAAASFAVSGLLGLAIGLLVRHSAGAVTAAVAVLLLPSLLGPLFGDFQGWVAGVSPTAALEKVIQTSDAGAEVVGSLGAGASLLLVAGYTVGVLLVAGTAFRLRDVH
ncbi:ABC transporter permease [Streptomyces sp. P38-E01]|uniref:ABC transporter permease n=1 Tax=Streptomyces tardus TaxID=2780544 RepID=A0A949JM48_9ACTN|nr:ABC transporter permease subunit [Streptomyces tardus]MBU7597646.1 ABC transporter permease [Streptomyces tardus]